MARHLPMDDELNLHKSTKFLCFHFLQRLNKNPTSAIRARIVLLVLCKPLLSPCCWMCLTCHPQASSILYRYHPFVKTALTTIIVIICSQFEHIRDLTRSLILSWIEARSHSVLRCPLNTFQGHHANAWPEIEHHY